MYTKIIYTKGLIKKSTYYKCTYFHVSQNGFTFLCISTTQRWTRLQILQMALQFCSKNMPNFHKRRFRYFEGYWVNKRRFFRTFGTKNVVSKYKYLKKLNVTGR